MQITNVKPKKSVRLDKSEVRALKKFMKGKTGFEASLEIGIQREILVNTIMRGSAAEKTVNKIREYFAKSN